MVGWENQLCVNFSKTVGAEIRPKLLLMTNRKSHTSRPRFLLSIGTNVDGLR